MKKIFLLLLLPLSMSLVSCGDDSTDNVVEVSVTSSADVLSSSTVVLKGYANGASGECGFCYSATNEDPNPRTCAYVETFSIKSDNSYELTVNDLIPATKYFYRAYAIKDQKLVLAKDVKSFTTNGYKLLLMDAENVSYSSVVIKTQAEDNRYEVGFCISDSVSVPTIENARVISAELQSDNTFSMTVDGLIPTTTYYYRSYARKNGIILYSDEIKKFTTNGYKLSLMEAENVSYSSAVLESQAEDNQYEVGFCISDSVSVPTIESARVISAKLQSDNSFSMTVDGLTPTTTYYYRSYARKDGIILYSDEIKMFTTRDYNLLLMEASDITYSSVVLKSQPEDYQTYVGFCISDTVNVPTIENARVVRTGMQGIDNAFSASVRGLIPTTTYYYRSFVRIRGVIFYSKDIKHFTTEALNVEAVDLGLSVKWASFNVGATAPEEYGDYFAWGETTAKTDYDWSTYFDALDEPGFSFKKYHVSDETGKRNIESTDDAATVNWGGIWRIPTPAEQEELFQKCTCTGTIQNGVYGFKVTGKNGNSIFFPAAGYRIGENRKYLGKNGNYWSSRILNYNSQFANYLYFSSDTTNMSECVRYLGLPIRPVCQ